jgi:hypothetical protein
VPRPARSGPPGPWSAALGATAHAQVGGALSAAHPRCWRRHPRPARPGHPGGRTGPGRGGRSAGPAPAAAGPWPPGAGGRPRRGRPRHPVAPSAAGLWLALTWDGMVRGGRGAGGGRGRPEPAGGGGQRNADALAELARRSLEGGPAAPSRWVRPQLTVTVELDSLVGHPGAIGGEVGWAGPLALEGVGGWPVMGPDPGLVSRHRCDRHHASHGSSGEAQHPIPDPAASRTRPPWTWTASRSRRPRTRTVSTSRSPATQRAGRFGGAAAGRHRPAPSGPGGRRPSRWRSGGPAGSSSPPNGSPWPCAAAAGWSPTAAGPWAGGRPSSAPLAVWRPDRSGRSGVVVPGSSSGGP